MAFFALASPKGFSPPTVVEGVRDGGSLRRSLPRSGPYPPRRPRRQISDPDRFIEQEFPMAARLRHIAISVPDPEKAAKFFEEAFGMTIAGRAGVGLYVTDGTINVALLKFPGEVPGFSPGHYGLIHFGMW